ncbi:unnamed protein product [Rotaria sordida]|uniref:Uncharacterized protein n=2 Tax=Rotaria sordida TaxID=392033 RepID=A0A819S6K6_9BILA|nr:unnamed protein product [Rotaria sordida]
MHEGALCYAELGCSYVSSGGDYIYLRLAFSNLIGFLRVWINVALLRLVLVVLSSLVFIIVAGIYRMYLGRIGNFFEPFEGSTYGKITGALYAGLFPYTGCSYFTALSAYDILISDATAVSFAECVLPFLLYIIPIGITMSCVGTASGNLFIVGQMFMVAGRDGLMPYIFSMKHYESNIPVIAILFEIILSFIFLYFISNIRKLIICVGMINWTCILLTVVGLIVLRYKHPNRERPIKVPLIISIVFISILIILIVTSVLNDLENISTSLFLLTTTIPTYMFCVMWKKKPSDFNCRYNSFVIMLQKLFHIIYDEHNE